MITVNGVVKSVRTIKSTVADTGGIYFIFTFVITSLAGAVAKYCDEYVCVCLFVCLSARISPEPHARSLPKFLCMLPIAVARSSSGVVAYVMYFPFVSEIIFCCIMGRIAV